MSTRISRKGKILNLSSAQSTPAERERLLIRLNIQSDPALSSSESVVQIIGPNKVRKSS